MDNPLDSLLSEALGDSILLESEPSVPNPSSTETETSQTEVSQSVSPSGEITSTVKLTFQTIRKARSNFSSNITDERYAAIIESAIGYATPLIKNLSGNEMAEMISYHMEVARFIQGVFYDHVRAATNAGAPVKVTQAELNELKAERDKERSLRLANENTTARNKKKKADRVITNEAIPVHERLLKSIDPAQRNAGKFMKSQITMGISEKAALKNWNDICVTANNTAGMILNVAGKRLDEVMKENTK